MRAPPALLALGLLLTGCVGAADPVWEEQRLSGVFLGASFAEEVDELQLFTRTQGGQFATLPGIPPGFLATGLTPGACKALHGFATTRTYLQSVSGCEPVAFEPSAAALEPAADPPSYMVSAPIG